MTNEDVFKGASSALTFFFAYQNTVAKEIGMERGAALQTKMSEFFGSKQGRMLKEQLGIKDNDAIAAIPMVKFLKDGMGFSIEIVEKSPKKVVIRNDRCPFYEAARTVGLDNKEIETACNAGSIKIADSVVKQLNPNLNIRVRKFRAIPDGFCDEEIVLS